MARPGRACVQRVPVHYAARGARDAHRPRDLTARRSTGDPQAHRLQDRAGGARRRSPVPSHQGGHANHGRGARAALHPDHHALVGRPQQPVRLGRAGGHFRFRRDRLGRRLPQGREEQSEGPLAEGKILLAITDRPRRGNLSRVCRVGPEYGEGPGFLPGLGGERIFHGPSAQRRPDRAVRQEHRLPARRFRLHHAQLLRHRRDLERSQLDRWAGRTRHHAGGDGRRRPWGIRDGHGAGGLLPLSAFSLHPRGRRAHGVLRGTRRCGPGLSLVQRVPGRRLHGRCGRAFPGRRARHGRCDRPAGDRAFHHGRCVRRGNALGDAPGALLQMERRQTHFPDGAAPSPLRALRVEGVAGRRAVLDHHHDARPVRSVYFEAAVNFAGRKVLVLGLGDTGLSMAKWLARRGASVRVADTRTAPPRLAELRRSLPGVAADCGPLREESFAGVDLIGISPGVPPSEPSVRRAAVTGIQVVGDIELFARATADRRPRTIAVTGTNGKSTVTALAGAMAREANADCGVAGNIGPSVLDALMRREDEGRLPSLWILELSSFQLETTRTLAPDAATVLNLSEDHLDRHRTMAEYAAVKARIFQGRGIQVLNRDDPRSLAMALTGRETVTFGLNAPSRAEDWGLIDRGGVPWLAQGANALLAVEEMKLAGLHNAANALAA